MQKTQKQQQLEQANDFIPCHLWVGLIFLQGIATTILGSRMVENHTKSMLANKQQDFKEQKSRDNIFVLLATSFLNIGRYVPFGFNQIKLDIYLFSRIQNNQRNPKHTFELLQLCSRKPVWLL